MAHKDRPETCAIPCSVINCGKDGHPTGILHNTDDSLSNLRITDLTKESWRHDSNIYWISFSKGQFAEFDYFARVIEFLSKMRGLPSLLQRIAVDCDFSVIS